ncbi:MAG: cytochrome c-type biogenesis protein CcmH [Nisaea sp.]|uniref:cytochrome c-type biogenesis protein n=1 Tax=Nisaea sp. TaxID=2024842 RepID=UPI001B2B66A1|nr:cytochrome c-type biogenesis protein [Nisaea sp.]MBO6559353.1 cytochrome c-type biogenesis protein CcmH [Nisaea sp.]
MIRHSILGLVLICLTLPVLAVEPAEMLKDPALEARARELSKEVRCLVCQNQSIDDSNAGLAKDLRVLLRERLVAGDSDAEIKEFLVERYGDFVLLKPPVKASTYVLWYGPLAVGVLGAIGVAVFLLRRRGGKAEDVAPAPLSDEEQRRIAALLDEQDRKA